ncbi:UDP-4-amino-4,6-dideoxy-N-acetyl-beta-L-altrosamine N-acetyltransferase [Chryseobacterium sp.]|uniref:UDP-4-amino-4, 6-dideoxy-N-acetyl-beta-L-altrosamine N-acetyltransferase n=1 Tax=Chryseobacterium sp. TaxID=1871047 RepID=UPI0028A0C2DF|nr:UDP-4-amino-4,6-dideoxy-N-acetyl-beta-L-altrosamine N-acetyltransferase [Chryseobacterium sp.]
MNEFNGNKYEFLNFININSEDKEIVLSWRNDESIRKWMYSQVPITLENHLNFIELLKIRKDKLYFLVKRNDENIGVFSLVDFDGFKGELGYYLSPDKHNGNLGVEFYYAILKYCFDCIEIKKIEGFALEENKGANSLNSLFGFEKLKDTRELKEGVFFQIILTVETWKNTVVNNLKIKKLLNLTNNTKH